MSYNGKVYRKQGGDELVVASGGKITQESGGAIVRPLIDIGENTTLSVEQAGSIFRVTAPDVVVSLPATEAGVEFTFVLAASALSAGAGLKLSPVAADQIIGNGFTPADDKDAILAGSGDRAGDAITLVGDGDAGYYITSLTGTWTREA